jgi:hypothetical protein
MHRSFDSLTLAQDDNADYDLQCSQGSLASLGMEEQRV